ncbi:hypothetical protein FJZ31_09655 [Candidatus Poribacteria bacterium]|nr:hypothetical protein [Candidatus Poribacteria bacterium]
MNKQTKSFQTEGPIIPEKNYFVKRQDEINDFWDRVEQGKYIVIFAPRQTGKTTFFYRAMDELRKNSVYIPIEMSFEIYSETDVKDFYENIGREIINGIKERLEQLVVPNIVEISEWLDVQSITNHLSLEIFFTNLHAKLPESKLVLIIDEFDGIPKEALRNFLHTLRKIYHIKSRDANKNYLHSVSIVGVRSVSQLDFDRSVSPFNIQGEFHLKNFTHQQIEELLSQYTAEVGQKFEPVVIELVYQKTAGQPFLVNRLAQILTEELGIPKTETITEEHFREAYDILLERDNTHFQHIRRNIKRKPEFKNILLQTIFNEKGVRFNIHNDDISELVTYGLIKKGEGGYCIIDNPIYQNVVINTFNPLINGLETEYLPDEPLVFSDYITLDNRIQLEALIDNFVLHIKRSGYKILAFPSPPQEFVGQYLLLTYLDIFISEISAHIYPEVSTGRGRMDIILLYQDRKYIIETKLWGGEKRYQEGKKQLARYLEIEQVDEGYYLVFDYRKREAEERREKENIHQKTILSYCIPVL